MKTVVLAGGFGSRLAEETGTKPKPMVEIGAKPILWHILKIYEANGFREFVIALGYKGEEIKKYFLNYFYLSSDLSINTLSGSTDVHDGTPTDWVLHLVDTGIKTQTGGRIKRLAGWLNSERFMLTYGDGLANVNLRKLVQYHEKTGKLATLTAVRPPARFGNLELSGDLVSSFAEKPQTGEGWINGGFFVMEPEVFHYLEGDECVLEREPLERLARAGQLAAYRHQGFWLPMDTLRDKRLLEELWASGKAPWKVW